MSAVHDLVVLGERALLTSSLGQLPKSACGDDLLPRRQERAGLHLPAVREELEPLMMRALVGICGVIELEMLYRRRRRILHHRPVHQRRVLVSAL
jgi:hypothetical protein